MRPSWLARVKTVYQASLQYRSLSLVRIDNPLHANTTFQEKNNLNVGFMESR
jgi:hypothetical protein